MKKNNKQTPLRYFLYARKSSESSERQQMSVPSQIKKGLEILGRQIDIVGIFEEHASAFSPGRLVFKDVLKRIKDGEADGIAAYHPDRLSRNEIDAAELTYCLRNGTIKDFKFVSYQFYNSPDGIWMLQQALSYSQYYSAKLSQEVRRGLQGKLEEGWRPGVAPTGYVNDLHKHTIQKDRTRFPLVQRAWHLILYRGFTPPQALLELNENMGFRTIERKKSGGKPLARSAWYKILNNPFYAGLVSYQGEIYNGKHDPMITMEEFNQVQFMLGSKGKPRPQTIDHAFTGMIRCGECGCLITAETKRKYIKCDNVVRYYTYYHCTRQKSGYRCSQPSVRVEELERQIQDLLAHITILPEFEQWALEVIRSRNAEESKDRIAMRDSIDNAIGIAECKRDGIVDMRCRELLSDEEFVRQNKKISKEIAELRLKRDSVDCQFDAWRATSERAIHFSCHAAERFKLGNNKLKRDILRTVGSEFILKDKILTVEPEKWVKVFMNHKKMSSPKNGTLEPKENLAAKGQTVAEDRECLQWLGIVDDIRTFFRDSETGFFIPDLTNLDSQESPPPSNSRYVE